MRESLRFVLVANDICSSISERDDDDDDDNERERVLESVKRTFCRFFPFVLRKQLLYFVASHGPQNGPKMVCDGPKMMKMTTERRLPQNKQLCELLVHTHTRQCRSWPRAKTWTTLERARYAERFTKRRLTPRAGTRFATTAWWNTAGNFGSFIIIIFIIVIINIERLVRMLLAPPLERRRRRRRRRRLRRTRRKKRKRRKTK